MDLHLCYLWLVALQPPAAPGPLQALPVTRDAPYFLDLDIEFRAAGTRSLTLCEVPIQVQLQVLDGRVWVAECRYTLADGLGPTAPERKRALHAALRQALAEETGLDPSLFEGYTIVLLRRVEPNPDAFMDQHAAALAGLLRSATKPLGQRDAAAILEARARFSSVDLTVVDWEGAVIIAEAGDHQSDVELLKIGNYQLLRYRMLDHSIEANLRAVRRNLAQARLSWLPATNRTLQSVVEQRLALLLDFEKIDQKLLLIGDWYSARVYRLIVEQFYLRDWKAAVSARLDSLAAIDGIVSQNLAFSWRRALDLVQFVGWLVLLVGYFVLFILDLGRR